MLRVLKDDSFHKQMMTQQPVYPKSYNCTIFSGQLTSFLEYKAHLILHIEMLRAACLEKHVTVV